MHHEFTPEEIERFWSYVDQRGGPDACWPWMRSSFHNGYGQFSIVRDGKTINSRAHRLAYLFANGEWPEPMGLHRCHSRRCCNPAHIYAGTAKENTGDMMALGRHNRPHAKFTDREVREIRWRRRYGGASLERLAADYSVTKGCISNIANRRSYRHVY
jgi:hypothetical protein